MPKDLKQTTDLPKKFTDYAIYLLSRRDYSTSELTKKLHNKFATDDESGQTTEDFYNALQHCLNKVIEYGYVNDERYSEAFVRSSSTKFRGPLRIRNELKQKGLANHHIASALETDTIDWFELAKLAFDRKFGPDSREQIKTDPKLKAKCYRYLSYRGFTSDQISYALDATE
ncbi:recombination regulator RecX [Sessilibacter sp. MAH1]